MIVGILKFILWRTGSQCNSERSLNLDGKITCVKEMFAKYDMRMEKVSVGKCRYMISEVILGCSRAVMICLTLTEVVEILRQA